MYTQTELASLEIELNAILRKAGDHILKKWQHIQKISFKDRRDIVTNVDVEVENMLREALSDLLPEAGFIVEEGENDPKEYNWVIDPIDGTKQYAYQLPIFTTQVALTYKEEPIIGSVLNPVSQQLFSASKGNGAKLNGIATSRKDVSSLKESIIELDFGGNDEYLDWKLNKLKKFAQDCYRVRMYAGIFGIYIVTGAIDSVISLGQPKIVDILPHDIIIKEAGLKVEYISVKDIGSIRVVSDPKTFGEIVTILQS